MLVRRTNRSVSKYSRRTLLAIAVAAGTLPGCASMKSPTDWFAKEPAAQTTPDASLTSSISSTSKGIAGQFKTMGTAVSSAMGKAKNAVTATFTTEAEGGDATSLASLPDNLGPEVWVANGQLFEAQNNFPKALDNYTKALERDPNNEAAVLSIARLYARQDQSERSVEFFRKAIDLNPNAAATHNELALQLQKQGNTAEAQVQIQKAIQLDSANPRYRNNLAGMLVKVGRSDEAVAQLQQIFDPAVANYNVAYLHYTNNNLAGAQQHLEAALRADPSLAPARELLTQLRDNPTTKSAMAAYNAAGQIYRTAQAFGKPAQAGNAVYQQPASGYSASGTPATPQSYVPPATTQPGMSQPSYGQPSGQPAAQPGSLPTSLPQASFAPGQAGAGQAFAGYGQSTAAQPASQPSRPTTTGFPGTTVSYGRPAAPATGLPTQQVAPTTSIPAAAHPALRPEATLPGTTTSGTTVTIPATQSMAAPTIGGYPVPGGVSPANTATSPSYPSTITQPGAYGLPSYPTAPAGSAGNRYSQ